MAKTKNFINESFSQYQKTGNMRPLIEDIRNYSINIASRYKVLDEFNDGELWGSILERVTVGIAAYDPDQGSPYKFISGLLHRHIWMKAIHIGRTRARCPVEFNEDIFVSEPDEPIGDEADSFVAAIVNRSASDKVRAFAKELRLCIREGKNILFARDRFEGSATDAELETIDYIIVKTRLKYAET